MKYSYDGKEGLFCKNNIRIEYCRNDHPTISVYINDKRLLSFNYLTRMAKNPEKALLCKIKRLINIIENDDDVFENKYILFYKEGSIW